MRQSEGKGERTRSKQASKHEGVDRWREGKQLLLASDFALKPFKCSPHHRRRYQPPERHEGKTFTSIFWQPVNQNRATLTRDWMMRVVGNTCWWWWWRRNRNVCQGTKMFALFYFKVIYIRVCGERGCPIYHSFMLYLRFHSPTFESSPQANVRTWDGCWLPTKLR